ncbi:MAG: hypothetical protein WA919_28605 [Coleofasciculaceae cyanobacterium]
MESAQPAQPKDQGASKMSDTNLPKLIANAVLETASEQLSLPLSQLRISQFERQTWRDRCLGLSRPTEKCIGIPTPGWRVTVESKQQFYVYRTNNSGFDIRTEAIVGLPTGNGELPYLVAEAVLQDAQGRLNLPTSGLHIVQAQRQTWSNACLDLANPGQVCVQAIVPGWRVTVEGKKKVLVYRTNDSGSLVRIEETN